MWPWTHWLVRMCHLSDHILRHCIDCLIDWWIVCVYFREAWPWTYCDWCARAFSSDHILLHCSDCLIDWLFVCVYLRGEVWPWTHCDRCARAVCSDHILLHYIVWLIDYLCVFISEEKRGVAVVELQKKEGCGLGLTVTGMHMLFLVITSCVSAFCWKTVSLINWVINVLIQWLTDYTKKGLYIYSLGLWTSYM